jgi:ABC-type branched-subunit amino acid transport system permease subunit
VLGTFLLSLLGKFLPAQEAQGLFYGGALIVILIVAPQGILGWIDQLVQRLQGNRTRVLEETKVAATKDVS